MKVYFKIIDITPAGANEVLENYLGQQDTAGEWDGETGVCRWRESTPIFSTDEIEEPCKSGKRGGPRYAEVSKLRVNKIPYYLEHQEGSEEYRRLKIFANGKWVHIAEKPKTPAVLDLKINFDGFKPGIYLYENGIITLTEFDFLSKTPNR